MGDCNQWKAIGQCSKGDSCSFSHDRASGNRCDQRREGQSSSPAPNAKVQTDGKMPSKFKQQREKSPSGTRGRIPCPHFFRGKCTYLSCNFWHPPVCLNYKSESGCKNGDKCRFRRVLRKEAKLGSNHTVQFSNGAWHHIKIGDRKGREASFRKCEPHEGNPCAPRFEDRTQDETLHQERCARREAWDLAKQVYKLKNTDKLRFILLLKPGQRRRPLQNLQRNEHSWLTPEHQCTC